MNAPVRMQDLFRVLLPRDCDGGYLGMLTGYFDDSGTHGNSEIVLVAGIFGTEGELDTLDYYWKLQLENPVCGYRPPLKRFHMADCQASHGEFAGWSRTETDYLCGQLRKAILKSHVAAYMCSVSRKDWDELITGNTLAILGNAEGSCIRNCFVKAVEWANNFAFDPDMTFVFDNRTPAVERDAKVVFDAFQRETVSPSITGIAFLSSYKIRPLQAADLIAWECYQYAKEYFVHGADAKSRPELDELTSNMRLVGQVAMSRGTIKKIAEFWDSQDPEYLRQMANHFSSFDPDNPDYSYLKLPRA